MSDAGSSLGPVFVGLLLALYLTATTNDQGYRYTCSTLDSFKVRMVVVAVLAISTAHTGILCYAVYECLVANFGNFDYLTKAEWTLVAHYALFTFIAVVVQLFYAARLATLFTGAQQKLLVAGVAVLALAQLAFGIVATYNTANLPSTTDIFKLSIQNQVAWQTLAGLLCSVLCTNFVTALCAFLNLIFFFVFHRNGVTLAFAIVIPKLYLVSMFANISRDENPSSGISSRSFKHESSLSDMFKGKPLYKGDNLSRSQIGLPVSQNAFDPPPPGSPTWRRTSVTPLERVNKADDGASVSDYGGFSTSIYLRTPKVYDEGHFSHQREGSPIVFSPQPPIMERGRHVGFAISSDESEESSHASHGSIGGRQRTTGYGFI